MANVGSGTGFDKVETAEGLGSTQVTTQSGGKGSGSGEGGTGPELAKGGNRSSDVAK
jgi:hypothetical protein